MVDRSRTEFGWMVVVVLEHGRSGRQSRSRDRKGLMLMDRRVSAGRVTAGRHWQRADGAG